MIDTNGTLEKFDRLAQKAAACALIRLHRPAHSEMDFEDMTQEAIFALWKNFHKGENYAFVCARNAAVRCFVRQLLGRNPKSNPLSGREKALAPPAKKDGLPDEAVVDLVKIFTAARKRGGPRTERAALRDAKICLLISQGYNNFGIGQELGIPAGHVRKYRQKIRRILAGFQSTNEELQMRRKNEEPE